MNFPDVNFIELLGYVAAFVNVGVYLMRTMIPLRIFAIATNLLFILYGFLASIHPMLVLHCFLLPLNSYRLLEMIQLVRRTHRAAHAAEFDLSFLRPYAHRRDFKSGATVFEKGEAATSLYLVDSGRFLLPESGIELSAGSMVGELGLLSPGGLRTQSLFCMEDGVLRMLSYNDFKQLFLQNPRFGYYFLQLTTSRLFENLDAMERALKGQGIPNPMAAQVSAAPT